MSETRPRRRRLRTALVVLAIVLVVPVAAGAALLASFDADHYKPQIVAAIKRATGRDVELNGNVRVTLNPRLSVEANDASLGNVPNGTRPDMATLQRVQAEVALWPLLHGHVEITRLVLIHPDILLETDAEGHPNWLFRHPGAEPPAVANAVATRMHGGHLDIQSVRISDGTLTWHDGKSGTTRVVGLKSVDVSEPSEDAPITIAGQVAYAGSDISVSGQLGSLARLRDPEATTPWPARLSLAADGAELSAEGTFSDPLHMRGFALKIEGKLPDLGRLAALVPDARRLPPLRDVALAVQVNDIGAAWPEPSAIVLHAGASDLGTFVPDLKLTKLDVSAPRFDQPVKVGVEGSYAETPLKLDASLGAPMALIPGLASAPFPVDISAEAAGASFNAKGGIATPNQTAGLDVKLTAKIPDLAALSPLVGRSLPKLTNIAFDGELVDRNASYLAGMMLKGIKLTLPEADVTGDAVLGLTSERPMLHATLSSSRIDADAITAAFAATEQPEDAPGTSPTAAPAASQTAPTVASSTPEPTSGTEAPAPNAQAPTARPTGRNLLFSDEKLPIDSIRKADGELRMTVGLLHSGGTEFRNIISHFRLTNGHVHVGPLEGQLPDGAFSILFDYNPNQPASPVVLTAHAPGLPLKPLLAALQLPDDASGALQVDADLKSSGDTPHAIAAGLTGHLGLALENGAVDNRLLAASVGSLLRDAKLPGSIGGKSGHSDVRCFAVRADANRGVVGLRTFALDMTHFHLTGEGTLNFADETLALRSRPMLKLAGTGVVVPVRIDGSMLAPRAQADSATAAAASAIASQAGGQSGSGADQPSGAADAPNCAAALALARGDNPAQSAALAAPPAPRPAPRPSRKLSGRELLRRLVR